MEIKSIDSLSIIECCDLLKINKQDLSNIIKHQFEEEKNNLILKHLNILLKEDEKHYQNCVSLTKNLIHQDDFRNAIKAYNNYLSIWFDGLWRKEAQKEITRLKSELEEIEFYDKNKNTISGCKAYIKRYPNGKYASEIKFSLNQKKRKHRTRNTLILLIIFAIAAILCWENYESTSYLNITGDGTFEKIGGQTQISYITDANINNIEITKSVEWFNIENDENGKITVIVPKNYEDERKGRITIKVYSSFWGEKCNCISKEIEIQQESGLPTYLNVNKDYITFDKFGNCREESNFNIETDGTELEIEPNENWFTITKDVYDNTETISANITVTGEINTEGEKSGYINIQSGNINKRVNIFQESGLATYFRVKRTALVMAEEGLEKGYCYPINVETDGTSWSVKYAPTWLTAYADINDKRLEVSVGPNNGKVKKDIITLVSNNGDIQDIAVIQKGDPTDFEASSSSIRFGIDSDYKYITIDNNSDKSLLTSDSESWLSCSVTNKNMIKISCSKNDSYPRSATVYVYCGNESLSIAVKQDGWIECRNCKGNGYIKCYGGAWDYTLGKVVHSTMRCISNWNPYSGWTYEWVTDNCPICGGDGELECSNCEGKGKIKESY